MHRSDVKFMCRLPGGMLAYETIDSVDMVVTHDSYLSLKRSLARHGMHILFIHQANAVIEDQESYSQIREFSKRRMLVLYRRADTPPFLYNGFQG